ncbi:MAG: dTMP kinase [Gemmatimonadaceae bacterium]
MAGTLIVCDGAEGVGKSTQVRRFAERMRAAAVPCLTVREPGGTPLGDDIRGILLHSQHELAAAAEALLFMASRAQHVERVIRPALAAGNFVLADRFFLATYAYQIAGRQLDAKNVVAANRLATGGLVPDLTLVFDLPVEEGLRRVGLRAAGDADRLERNDVDFHRRVGDAFRQFATKEWQREHPEGGRIVLIDALGDEETVERRVQAVLAAELPDLLAGAVPSHS